jgi:hypothetical protein
MYNIFSHKTKKDQQLELKDTIIRAATRIAIVIETKTSEYILCTHRADIINLFFNDKRYQYLGDTCSDSVEVFDLIKGEPVKININNYFSLHFIGIPAEVPPPVYLNPLFANVATDEQLLEMQTPSLLLVKKTIECGFCNETPYSSQDQIGVLKSAVMFLRNELNFEFTKKPELEIYGDILLGGFPIHINSSGNKILLRVCEGLPYIKPAVAAKKHTVSNQSDLIDYLIKGEVFEDIKPYWISYIKEKQQIYKDQTYSEYKSQHVNFIEDFNSYLESDIFSKYFADKNFSKIASDIDILLKMFFAKANNENSITEAFDEYVSGILYKLQIDVSSISDDEKEKISQFRKDIFDKLVLQHGINGEYLSVIKKIENVDVEKDLDIFNDYLIVLRYWPECFPERDSCFENLRPLTELEFSLLRYLHVQGIHVKLDANVTDVDYNNSLLDRLNVYIGEMREKRLNQIIATADERVAAIEEEIQPIWDSLTEEEKDSFKEVIEDTGNIEKYKLALEEESDIINIVQYWPIELYPKPDNIFVK